MDRGEVKLILTQKLHFYWLGCPMLEAAVHVTRGEESPLFYGAVTPESHSIFKSIYFVTASV